VERDAIEPRAQAGFAVEAANAAEDLDEDLLRDVGSIGWVVETARDERVEGLMILGDENAKRFLGTGLEVGYEGSIFGLDAIALARLPTIVPPAYRVSLHYDLMKSCCKSLSCEAVS